MIWQLHRVEGAEADFKDWYFGDETELLLPFIKKTINDAISVVFSGDGAVVSLDAEANDVFPGDLRLKCDIQIDEFEAYASADVSLRALINDAAEFAVGSGLDDDVQKMAAALRAMADEIDPPTA